MIEKDEILIDSYVLEFFDKFIWLGSVIWVIWRDYVEVLCVIEYLKV